MRKVVATLTYPPHLKGTGTEGPGVNRLVRIEALHDSRDLGPEQVGYELLAGGTRIRFVLKPGMMGFHDASDGLAEVYVSGPFNKWGGTMVGHPFTPLAPWKAQWNEQTGRYELTVATGAWPGQVSIAGSEFKFTVQTAAGQEWYPAENLPIGAAVVKRGLVPEGDAVYTGADLGHTYTPASTRFRIWAPAALGATVRIYHRPLGGVPHAFHLKRDKGGTWLGEIPGDLKGRYYTFGLDFGRAEYEVMDPYAVGAGINGDRALIVGLRETDPPGWQEHRRPPLAAATDAIIYEIHVRDISTHQSSGIRHRSKFLAFTEEGTRGPGGVRTGLDHLKEMGVTHVHLLPAFDFATVDEARTDQFNWGYDPKNFNVPEGSYATDPNGTARITEFKQMVMALHRAGIRVVMDVVYNHTSIGASPFEKIAPHYYYRYDADGRPSNGAGTGNETASERPMMRKYIVDSVRFWATEYRIDGFRFDLMALHDVETMRQVRAALDRIDPSIILYGEPWTGGHSPLDPRLRMTFGRQRGTRIGLFNDRLRNGIKGDNDGDLRGFATGAGGTSAIRIGVAGSVDDFALHPEETINYVSSHDNLTLWDKITRSNGGESEADRIRMNLLSQAIVFTSQGVVFIQGGEEMLRTKRLDHNSYNAPDAVNQLDWRRKASYRDVFGYYRGLVQVRRAHPAFRLRTGDQVREHLTFLEEVPGNTIAFWLRDHAGGDRWRHIVVVYNPNRYEVEVALPGAGLWEVSAYGMKAGDGPVAPPVSGAARVPPLSMMMLFQQ